MAAASGQEDPPKTGEEWQSLYIGKTRVGYIRSISSIDTVDGRKRLKSHTETAMSIARFGQKVKLKVTMESEETPEGDWLGFTSFMENPPSLSSRTEGRVEGDQLFLTTMVGGKTTEKKQPWNTTLKSPAWQDRMLREQPLKPGEERTLESFEPQFSRPMTVTIKALEPEEITMPGGERRKLNKIAVTQSLDPKLVQYSYLDDDLKTVKTTTMMLGTEMVTWSVSKEEALKELSGEDVDLAIATLIRTGKIERSLETQSVVYRVTLVDDDPAKYLTEGPTQSIRRIDPHTVELTVRSLVPPESAEVDAKPADERYLRSNKFLQSDDELVMKFADEAVAEESKPWPAAQSLERWVHQKVKDKNFSTLMASAAEVARTLSGDCTEHACLLAAMCRAKKIPARIVVGLLYVPRDSAFGGHMWTEAYINGVWVPLDATLGRGRVAADHIKFLDAGFDDADSADGLAAFVPVVSARADEDRGDFGRVLARARTSTQVRAPKARIAREHRARDSAYRGRRGGGG